MVANKPKYRQVATGFWTDNFILDLEIKQKYFYLYLLTNENTTQLGVCEFNERAAELMTGLDKKEINSLIKFFVEKEKILYDEKTKEIFIKKWNKYNENNSPNMFKHVLEILPEIKSEKIFNIVAREVFEKCVYSDIDYKKILKSFRNQKSMELIQYFETLSIPYTSSMQGASSSIQGASSTLKDFKGLYRTFEEEEKEKEKEKKEKEEEKRKRVDEKNDLEKNINNLSIREFTELFYETMKTIGKPQPKNEFYNIQNTLNYLINSSSKITMIKVISYISRNEDIETISKIDDINVFSSMYNLIKNKIEAQNDK